MLEIKDLSATVEGTTILQGINLAVKAGEIHAIMGPNGSGKSTLSKVIAGHPSYTVTGGSVNYLVNRKPIDLLELAPDERAKEGIFLGFQYPVEIPGVSNKDFLRESFNEVCSHQGIDKLDDAAFKKLVDEKLKLLEMNELFLERDVNAGFSGGEKKKNEILQMALLNPRLALLDETDSGLDIDALRIVARGVNAIKSRFNAIVLVTHYQRLLDLIVPDYVHVLYKGRIIKSGDKSLALELEKKGYDWLIAEAEGKIS
ncbi:MAG: Fe-S cluster assembly ATPase SufC [Bacteriovoracia bacterium]